MALMDQYNLLHTNDEDHNQFLLRTVTVSRQKQVYIDAVTRDL